MDELFKRGNVLVVTPPDGKPERVRIIDEDDEYLRKLNHAWGEDPQSLTEPHSHAILTIRPVGERKQILANVSEWKRRGYVVNAGQGGWFRDSFGHRRAAIKRRKRFF